MAAHRPARKLSAVPRGSACPEPAVHGVIDEDFIRDLDHDAWLLHFAIMGLREYQRIFRVEAQHLAALESMAIQVTNGLGKIASAVVPERGDGGA